MNDLRPEMIEFIRRSFQSEFEWHLKQKLKYVDGVVRFGHLMPEGHSRKDLTHDDRIFASLLDANFIIDTVIENDHLVSTVKILHKSLDSVDDHMYNTIWMKVVHDVMIDLLCNFSIVGNIHTYYNIISADYLVGPSEQYDSDSPVCQPIQVILKDGRS